MPRTIQRRRFLSAAIAVAGGATASGLLPRLQARPQSRPELLDLTAVAAVTAMRSGDFKAEDYAAALLDRAQRLAGLNAFRTLDRELCIENARAADRARASGARLGIMHGLPIPVKDSVNTRTLPTTNCTHALRSFRPNEDAGVVQRLASQGAIVMGKSSIHELSFGWTSNNPVLGPVRNPYDQTRAPGGSSGGSGVAVAAHMAPLAIAEDTLGSIRVPASMCGVTGYRPSFGRYPGDGIMPLTANTFDQVGPVARRVEDLVLFDQAVTGDVEPLPATPLNGVRIGIAPEDLQSGLDPEVERIINEALDKLRSAGAEVVSVRLPEAARSAMDVVITIICYEMMPAMTAFLADQGTGVTFEQLLDAATPAIQEAIKGYALPPNRPAREVYESMLARRRQIREEIRQHYDQHRIVAMAFPPIMIPPPRIGEETEFTIRGSKLPLTTAMARNTALGSCANLASLILPAGLTSGGLPVGIEFDAYTGSDRLLLSLGQSLESALGPIPAPKV